MTDKLKTLQKLIGQSQTRVFAFDARELGLSEDAQTIDISFSSETPVYRSIGGMRFHEILDHSPEASVDLTRLNSGGQFIRNHDPNQVMGVAEDGTGRIDQATRKGRVGLRFSERPEAQLERRDVLTGVRRNFSFDYEVTAPYIDTGKKIDGLPVLRAMAWRVYSVCTETHAADITVGFERKLQRGMGCSCACCTPGNPQACCCCCPNLTAPPLSCNCACCNSYYPRPCCCCCPDKPGSEPSQERAATKPVEVKSMDPKEQNNQPVSEIARATEIMELAAVIDGPSDTLAQQIGRTYIGEAGTSEKTIVEFRQRVHAKREEREKANPTPVKQAHAVELSDKDKKQFSISRAILADANIRDRTLGGDTQSLEVDVSQEIRKNLNAPGYKDRGGILIPTTYALRGAAEIQERMSRANRALQQRAGMDTQTATAGQELVFTEYHSFIELLRNRAMVMALGATVLPGLQGNPAFNNQSGAGTFSWVGENPGVDAGESNLTLGQRTMSPKTGQSTTSYSRQLLAQGVSNVDALVLNDMSKISALAVDRAAIHGTGGSQPTGVYSTSGVNSVAMGGAITFDKCVDMETEIANDNADIGSMAYLTTPGVRGKAKKTAELSNTLALSIWREGQINGYRAEATNQVSKTLGAGAEHGIIFAVWSELIVGEWGAMEIITDPYALKKQGMIEVTNFLMVDVLLRYLEAFCKGTGLTV